MLLHNVYHLLTHRRILRLSDLEIFKTKIEILLDVSTNHRNEKIAFLCWEYLQCFEIIEKYYKVFDLLKTRKYFDAWCELEKIEILFLDFKRNSVDYSVFKIIRYIDEYIQKFQKLYPYKLFISPEVYVKKQRCSICNKIVNPFLSCNHISGRVYLGKLCYHIVEDMEFISTAVVEKPQQKYSVLFEEKENPERYQVLEYIIPKLDGAFENWDCSVYTEYIIDRKYRIDENLPCPCGSKRKYFECCKSKLPQKPRPHYELVKL